MSTPAEQKKLAEQLALASQLGGNDPDAPYNMDRDPLAKAISTTGDVALKGIEYPGGIIRTGLGLGAGAMRGGASPDYKEAAIKALKFQGHWPSGEKMLEQAGVLNPDSEGSILGGLLGFGVEAATDPLTYLTIGGRTAKGFEELTPRMRLNPRGGPGGGTPPKPPAAEAMQTFSDADLARFGEDFLNSQAPALPSPPGDLPQTWGYNPKRPEIEVKSGVYKPYVNDPGKPPATFGDKLTAIGKWLGQKGYNSLRAPSKFTAWAGGKIHESAFGPLRLQVAKENRKDVVDQLYKAGVWGTPEQRYDRLMAAREHAGNVLGKLYAEGDSRGAMVDWKGAIAKARAHAQELVDAGLLEPEDARIILNDLMGTFRKTEYPSMSQAARWKTQVQRAIPESRWSQLGRKNMQAESEAIANTLQSGLSEAILQEAERTMGKGGRQRIESANHVYGSLSDARRPVRGNAMSEARTSIFDVTDPLYITGEMVNPNGPMGEALVIKKLAQGAVTPTVQSTGGAYLRAGAENPWMGVALDNITRRMFMNNLKPDEGEEPAQ